MHATTEKNNVQLFALFLFNRETEELSKMK